jgi:ferritin-like metal-binding protein YciE
MNESEIPLLELLVYRQLRQNRDRWLSDRELAQQFKGVTARTIRTHCLRLVTCEAIEGIIAEAKEHMGEIEDQEILDAGMIGSAQAVEHYEITRYGTFARRSARVRYTEHSEAGGHGLVPDGRGEPRWAKALGNQ